MTTEIQELDTVIKGPDGYIVTTLKQAKKMQEAASRITERIDKRLAEKDLTEKQREYLANTRDICELLHAVCKEQIEIAEAAQREEKA